MTLSGVGMTNDEIGGVLPIASSSIKGVHESGLAKLDALNRKHAVRQCFRLNVFELDAEIKPLDYSTLQWNIIRLYSEGLTEPAVVAKLRNTFGSEEETAKLVDSQTKYIIRKAGIASMAGIILLGFASRKLVTPSMPYNHMYETTSSNNGTNSASKKPKIEIIPPDALTGPNYKRPMINQIRWDGNTVNVNLIDDITPSEIRALVVLSLFNRDRGTGKIVESSPYHLHTTLMKIYKKLEVHDIYSAIRQAFKVGLYQIQDSATPLQLSAQEKDLLSLLADGKKLSSIRRVMRLNQASLRSIKDSLQGKSGTPSLQATLFKCYATRTLDFMQTRLGTSAVPRPYPRR